MSNLKITGQVTTDKKTTECEIIERVRISALKKRHNVRQTLYTEDVDYTVQKEAHKIKVKTKECFYFNYLP